MHELIKKIIWTFFKILFITNNWAKTIHSNTNKYIHILLKIQFYLFIYYII